jgi:DUF1009 family protein
MEYSCRRCNAADTNQLAFYSIAQLSSLLRHHKITSVINPVFFNRLKNMDTLHCVISLTEQIAMEQAKQADEAFAKVFIKSTAGYTLWS